MNKWLAQLVPFMVLGFFLVVLIAGVILFSYLLILGAFLGLILFALKWVKDRFFRRKSLTSSSDRFRSGRTFDHRE